MTSVWNKISTAITQPSTFFGATETRENQQILQPEAPQFTISSNRGIWNGDPRFIKNGSEISSRQLFKRPLVVAFYSTEWKEYAEDYLQKLLDVQQQIKSLGGHLLVITDASQRELRQLATCTDLQLNLYADPENLIAEQFGVYDAENPVYNRVSGIEKNVPLLAAFVISSLRRILYKHVNHFDGNGALPVKRLLEAVNLSAHIN
ncbi:MAG: redoxin domain-containing protein [Mucilaginibacter polytrichastri]|nr:redoxin domain-containing protein [Mucilaginibacter polytrichastri]